MTSSSSDTSPVSPFQSFRLSSGLPTSVPVYNEGRRGALTGRAGGTACGQGRGCGGGLGGQEPEPEEEEEKGRRWCCRRKEQVLMLVFGLVDRLLHWLLPPLPARVGHKGGGRGTAREGHHHVCGGDSE
jgi:hypothetical protein